jgi:hypothetical protein
MRISTCPIILLAAVCLLVSGGGAAPLTVVPLTNADFSQGADVSGVPTGWRLYGGSPLA